MNCNRLKELRKSHNFTQMKLAALLHVEQSSISDWERGKTKPDFDNQRKLADLYGITIDELFGRNVSQNTYAEHIDNNGVIGQINAPITISNDEHKLNSYERELLKLFNSVDVKAQLKIMQYAYNIVEEIKKEEM